MVISDGGGVATVIMMVMLFSRATLLLVIAIGMLTTWLTIFGKKRTVRTVVAPAGKQGVKITILQQTRAYWQVK